MNDPLFIAADGVVHKVGTIDDPSLICDKTVCLAERRNGFTFNMVKAEERTIASEARGRILTAMDSNGVA